MVLSNNDSRIEHHCISSIELSKSSIAPKQLCYS